MEIDRNNAKGLPIRFLWGAMLLATVAVCMVAAFRLPAFPFERIVFLVVGIVVAGLLNQHQITIPRTSLKVSPKELTVFFATIWMGIPGAVLLSAAAGIARIAFTEKNRFEWLFSVFNSVTAGFVSSTVFYIVLSELTGTDLLWVGAEPIHPLWLASALGTSATVHFVVTRTVNALFAALKRMEVVYEPLRTQLLRTSVPYLLNFGSAFLLHFVFSAFGLSFGWVVLGFALITHLAYRVHHQRLEQKIREIREASRIHLATVEALATAIDARDQVGRGHVLRTQIYAVGIGRMMNLPEPEIRALGTGALLHDIGKLAVPDHILNKPGRLTPAEMEKIKIHASVGASVLESIGFSDPVIPTIQHHHESWDGSGYPDGLKAKKIPLTARVLAVADAYDTLRGARPYREAVSREEARRFLINGAGTQFDPTVVDVFCRNLNQFEATIREKNLAYEFDSVADETALMNASEDQSYIEQIKRANREVFTLYELARTFSSSLSIDSIYPLFASKIRELVPFDTCVIYLHNEITDEAQAVYAEGVNDAEIRHAYVKSGEGGTGFALKKRQASSSSVPNLDFSFSQVRLSTEYTAMASLPLIAKERLLGAVSIYSCTLSGYEDEHLRLLETVSRIASDAIFKSINHAESESRALTDPMTGLPNARSLQIQFEKESARSDRNDAKFQVLMLDLDGFKSVNDTFGHKVGDKLLNEIAKVMRGQLRDYDFIARYAGDEFVAIIPETDNRSVQDLCQRIENAVSNFVLPIGDGRFARVGISIGAASYPSGGRMLDQLLIAADKAMYEVKVRRKRLKLAAAKAESEPMPAAPPENPPSVMKEAVDTPPAVSNVTVELEADDVIFDLHEESFVVEIDESNIISNAIN